MPSARWNDLRAFRDFLDAIIVTHEDGLTLCDVLELWDYETGENARKLASFRASPGVQARIHELAEKCTEGELTPEERAEYDGYVEALDVLSIVQAKARSALARDDS